MVFGTENEFLVGRVSGQHFSIIIFQIKITVALTSLSQRQLSFWESSCYK